MTGDGDPFRDPGDEAADDLTPDKVIVCVDCGGRAHLLTHPRTDDPTDGPQWWPGDIVAYRCEDCLDRWDLVLPED